MTEKDNLELVAKAIGAVFNGHDLTAMEKYWAESYIQHNPLAKSGREEFKKFFQQWINATPGLKWEPILQPVGSGDQVWVYGKYTGTFKNDWMGMKANGKRISFAAVDIFRVEKGSIAEHWDVVDYKTLFDQMK
jgi:predicted SnoaL-like aldol condensation-catalyzing enzyme